MKRLILLMLLLQAFTTYAQVDTVSIKKNNLETKYLKEGNNQYISWIKNNSTGTIINLLLWERKISFAQRDGKDVVIVSQNRIYEDSTKKTFVYTVSDRRNFKTIYDYRTRDKKAIQAFNYNADGIVAADTVKDNTKAGFNLKFTEIPYCFELDLETLSMLPLKHTGQQLAINFYHPGGSVPPKYYPVEVLREETVPAVNGSKINCWVIKLTYDSSSYDLSWISKKDHEFLKLESHNGKTVYNKVKLFTSNQGF